jgi:hypothetical protein
MAWTGRAENKQRRTSKAAEMAHGHGGSSIYGGILASARSPFNMSARDHEADLFPRQHRGCV